MSTKNFRIVRSAQDFSRSGMSSSSELRSYKVMVGRIEIGSLYNVSAYAFSSDESRQWALMFYATKNFILKRRFEEADIEKAIDFTSKFVESVLKEDSAYPEFKERILERNPELKTIKIKF